MDRELKRRSGSFGVLKDQSVQASSNDSKRLSMSEGSIVDRVQPSQSNPSPGSSEGGTLKKPRKFKPKKFIAKRLNMKKKEEKSTEELTNTADVPELETTKKINSPKLQRFKNSFVKRFSGKKSYKVAPMGSESDEKTNLKKLENFSQSESSIKDTEDTKTPEPDDLLLEDELTVKDDKIVIFSDDEKPIVDAPITKETVTLESRKVQLKITISGKKVEKINAPTETLDAIDRASASQKIPQQNRKDIVLPSAGTTLRLSTVRDDFFNVMVPNVEQKVDCGKPISCNDEIAKNMPVTYATVVREGSVGQLVPKISNEGSKEIEKYLILTSSLNTIISAAKELDDLSSGVQDLKFPENLPELKITEHLESLKIIEGLNSPALIEEPVILKTLDYKTEQVKPEIKEPSSSEIVKTIPDSDQDSSDEMKKNQKKSKIPVDKKRMSVDATDKEVSTVHTQEAHKPYHLNLSSSSSSEESKISPTTTNSKLQPVEIKFEVGTPVRPLRVTSATSVLVTAPTTEILSDVQQPESLDASFHSQISEQGLSIEKNESTRRRIAYVPQLTIYTAEEQELLRSNIKANATASESFDLSSIPPDTSVFPVFDENVTGIMSSSPEKREHLYKILVIGELGTGKTSFIKRYVHQFFSQNYRATIGVDFALKVLYWDQSTIIRLQLWDIAGQERFGNMTRVYYKEAVGAFIVFDVTRSATFDAVIKWKQDLDSKVQLPDGSPIPCILLANKCDQQKQGLVTMPAKMDEYCKENGFAGWFETSAKDNVNIEESAKALVSKILINDKLIHNDTLDGDRLMLNEEDINKPKKFCSC